MAETPLFGGVLRAAPKRLTAPIVSNTSRSAIGTPGTDCLLLLSVTSAEGARLQRLDVKASGTSAAPTACLVRFWHYDGSSYYMFAEIAVTTTPVPSDSVAGFEGSKIFPDGYFLENGDALYATCSVINAAGNQFTVWPTLVEI
jgi:hypothetical protein